MNDPRHPVQPAPSLPRTAPMAPAAPRPPMAHPAAPPAQRIPQAQPAIGLPRVGAPPMARPAIAPAAMPAAPAKPQAAPHAPHAAPAHAAPPAPAAADDDAISLVEDADGDAAELLDEPAHGPSKIKFGADLGIKKHAWKRQLKQGGMGATRVRTFHGKLSDQGLEYIDEAINLWLDEHPEIDVKFVTTNVGMFDGKFKDLALVVNVWY